MNPFQFTDEEKSEINEILQMYESKDIECLELARKLTIKSKWYRQLKSKSLYCKPNGWLFCYNVSSEFRNPAGFYSTYDHQRQILEYLLSSKVTWMRKI